jgi:hypothetical protein
MLFLEPQPLETDDDLRAALQNAIRLEHATIPPYLTARATLKGTSPSVEYARKWIKRIVVEEMLHMTLACNILNAIGGHPVIADQNEVPKYPGKLPMGVAGGLVVHLRRYSKALVEDTFMKIEEPEDPLDIPIKPQVPGLAQAPMTIGQFYGRIRERIDGHPELFTGDPGLQVSVFRETIRVTDVDTALQAIDIIVQQGEGTPKSPLYRKEHVAHYYLFQQFSKGMRIADDASSPLEVSFDPGQLIKIDDTADVIQMVDDPSTVTYDPADSHAESLAVQADSAYSDMLRALHDGFNGKPDQVDSAIDLMVGKFKRTVDELLQQQLTAGPHAGQFAGPRYRYIP